MSAAAAAANATANDTPTPTVSVAIAKPANGANGASSGASCSTKATGSATRSGGDTTPPRGVVVPPAATLAAPASVSTALTATDFPYPATQYTPLEFDAFVRALYRSAFGFDARTDAEKEAADKVGAALTFGEVLPSGVAKMLDDTHLNARNATVLYDIGCGFGKLALQAFLTYDNLEKVVGVELCASRYLHGAAALRRLAEANPLLFTLKSTVDTIAISVPKPSTAEGMRTLELRNRNLFHTPDVKDADVVICETAFPAEKKPELVVLLSQLKAGVRFLLYHNLSHLPGVTLTGTVAGSHRAQLRNAAEPGSRVLAEAASIAPGHVYPSSWAPDGAVFDTWRKL